jgi:ring-1,2-phenylacetyl-CoA epoxidase subunit PaaE
MKGVTKFHPVESLDDLGFVTLPTVGLFILAWILFVISTFLGIQQVLPLGMSVLINSIAVYLAYSVVHEASHYLLSNKIWLNDFLGHLAMLLLTPTLGFLLYRAVHFCHHQHTNQSQKNDPDLWLSRGSLIVKLIKWLSMDLYYFHFYMRNLAFKTRKTTFLPLLALASTVCFLGLVHSYDLWEVFIFYVVLPTRLTNIFLSWTFAYLPHAPHNKSDENDPLITTNTKLIDKQWLNSILLGHNYHLVHHLNPSVPFFRYAKAWQLIRTIKHPK